MKCSLVRTGRIGELQVQLQLLKLGFNVFDNVCDDDGIDLVIEKDGIFKSINVKKASKLETKAEKTGRETVGFGLGKTNKKPDIYICIYKKDFWIIPGNMINTKAWNIPIHPKYLSRFDAFKNNWDSFFS